jgi:[ribosomal protein S5]-alanine N-acetyltransferase
MNNSFDKRDIFIAGKLICLKVLTEQDAVESNWYGWFNDEETTKQMQKHYFPNTKEMQLDFLKNNIQDQNTKMQLGIVTIDNPEKLIGCVSLNNIDYINRKADISTIIGEKEERNIKSFLEANSLLIKHAFFSLNMKRIYGGTMIKEVADIMCRVLGFKHEGVLRKDIYKNNEYHDVYLIGVFKDEFKEIL